MTLDDDKKVQTLINRCANDMQVVRDAVARIADTRQRFIDSGAGVAGTPLAGNVTALTTAFTALQTEAGRAIWTQLIAAKVPSHEGNAL